VQVSDIGCYTSVICTSHAKTGLPCQDAGSCRIVSDQEGRDALLAVVSDGAGSASRSLDGARLAVDRFLRDFGDVTRSSELGGITREFVGDWLCRVRCEIRHQAETRNLSPREFACTILGAIVGHDQAAFFQIGDGAIVVSIEPSRVTTGGSSGPSMASSPIRRTSLPRIMCSKYSATTPLSSPALSSRRSSRNYPRLQPLRRQIAIVGQASPPSRGFLHRRLSNAGPLSPGRSLTLSRHPKP
jgi:Protein phosphatase 2C